MKELVPSTITAPVGGYHVIRCEVLNVTSSAQQLKNMLDAAWAAHDKMKARGETEFEVNVNAGNGYSLEKVARNVYERFIMLATHCAQKRKAVHEMTEEEKLAICVASGVPLAPIENRRALMFKLQTAAPCAIVLMDEGYRVFVKRS